VQEVDNFIPQCRGSGFDYFSRGIVNIGCKDGFTVRINFIKQVGQFSDKGKEKDYTKNIKYSVEKRQSHDIIGLYINNTPTEVIEAATSALRNEIIHLLHECQTYGLRLLKIDRKLVFEDALPLEKSAKKKLTLDSLYENIKLLHAEIFAYYSKLQNQKLEVAEVKEQERLIFSSRNIMNSIKNFKGIRNDLDEFDGSENVFMNDQYNMFRKRLHKLYHEMKGIQKLENREEQYHILLKTFVKIEEADKRCIKQTISAVAEGRIQELEISTMLLVNRLFTQACRLQIFSLKDLLLAQEQISNFDRALDMKEIIEEEKLKEA